jgi:hypothetical protein
MPVCMTHSPFMLDLENIFDLRTVQDVVVRQGKRPNPIKDALAEKMYRCY